MTYPAGTPSMCTTRPQDPHSSSTSETQASFSSSVEPKSAACLPRCSDSSQNTHLRHRLGRSSRLSKVRGATCQDKSNLRRQDHHQKAAAPRADFSTIDRSSMEG